MKRWLTSLDGTLSLSVMALFTELWRHFWIFSTSMRVFSTVQERCCSYIGIHHPVRRLGLGTATGEAWESPCSHCGIHYQPAFPARSPGWLAGCFLPVALLRALASV